MRDGAAAPTPARLAHLHEWLNQYDPSNASHAEAAGESLRELVDYVRQVAGADGGDWRPVLDFPDYEVSNFGEVRRVTGGRGARIGYPLRAYTTKRGYQQVALRTDGRTTSRLVCQLVCEAFHGPRPEGMEVRHLDGDPSNDVPSNVVWGTHHENMQDIKVHGTHYNTRKTHCLRGHEFNDENTMPRSDKGRRCRVCHNERTREYKRKKEQGIA